MRIKQLLTKTLLAAAGLCVGASAWAEDVYSNDFNSETTPFSLFSSSGANRIGVIWEEHVVDEGDYYAKYKCSSSSGGVPFAYYNFSSNVSDASTVTFEFDFYVYQGSWHSLISIADATYHTGDGAGFTGKSNTGYGSTGAIFNFGCYRKDNKNEFAINSTQNSSLTASCLNTWCHAVITVDNVGKTVDYTIKNADQSATITSGENIAFLNATATRCSQIDIYLGSNTGNYVCIDNLVITKTVSSTNHTYTVNAVAEETTIKQLATGMVAESAAYSTYVPKVINYNGSFYVLDDEDNTNLSDFYASYTMGTSDEVKEINYTLNPNIVYYGDWETAYSTGSGNYGVENEKAKLSQGQGRTIKRTGTTMDLTFKAPVAGKYQIEIPYLNTNSSDRTHIIYLDGTEDANKLEEKSVAKNGGFGTYSEEVTLTAGSHTIYVKCSYNLTAAMDYLMVKLNSVSPSVTDYATFSSPYALDFSAATGVKAYYASASDGSVVEMTTVTGAVAAGTGLLLQKTDGAISIPTAATGTDLSAKNLLKAGTGATVVSDEDFSRYVLAGEDDATSFYNLATAYAVPVGKAYLEVAKTSGARLAIVFSDDETTGIANVEKTSAVAEGIYNLNGQRVAAPQKGLYIVNGKKVIKK